MGLILIFIIKLKCPKSKWHYHTGKLDFTDDLNILVKNMRPVVPPGIWLIRKDNIAINCRTAHNMVKGVDCKCKAK